MLKIVGLGPGNPGLLTAETTELLKNADCVVLRTKEHPTVSVLSSLGIEFSTCDHFYDNLADFDAVYEAIAEHVLALAHVKDVVYAVPGSPMVAERTVAELRKRATTSNVELCIFSAVSFLDELFARLQIDPLRFGVTVVDANDIWQLPTTLNTPLIVTQVYDARTLSEAKLALSEVYGDEYQVVFAANLGLSDEIIKRVPIFELDRIFTANHLTSIFVPQSEFSREPFDMYPLTDIMARLRSKDGCVWDNEQTHETLRRYIVEEVYEVLEAIEMRDPGLLCEELGDLLLQIVFHARIAEENGEFTVQEVIDGVCEKMIRRHPHVFGEITVRDSADVLINWEKIKAQEKKEIRSVLAGIPVGLPALMYAQKMQEKASKVGFDWQDIVPVWDKVNEEITELKRAVASGKKADIENEFGDVLFTLVNLGRFLGLESETALNAANLKFRSRFDYIEQKIGNNCNKWNKMSLKMLDKCWEEAKIIDKTV